MTKDQMQKKLISLLEGSHVTNPETKETGYVGAYDFETNKYTIYWNSYVSDLDNFSHVTYEDSSSIRKYQVRVHNDILKLMKHYTQKLEKYK